MASEHLSKVDKAERIALAPEDTLIRLSQKPFVVADSEQTGKIDGRRIARPAGAGRADSNLRLRGWRRREAVRNAFPEYVDSKPHE